MGNAKLPAFVPAVARRPVDTEDQSCSVSSSREVLRSQSLSLRWECVEFKDDEDCAATRGLKLLVTRFTNLPPLESAKNLHRCWSQVLRVKGRRSGPK